MMPRRARARHLLVRGLGQNLERSHCAGQRFYLAVVVPSDDALELATQSEAGLRQAISEISGGRAGLRISFCVVRMIASSLMVS